MILFLTSNNIFLFILSAVDTGRVFCDITEIFWRKIRVENLNGGQLFQGDNVCLIQQNSTIIEFDYPKIIGKLLFWSWIQMGSWPRWLDQIHMQYTIDGNSVSCTSSLLEHISYLYKLSHDVINDKREIRKNDLNYWITERGLDVSYLTVKFRSKNI